MVERLWCHQSLSFSIGNTTHLEISCLHVEQVTSIFENRQKSRVFFPCILRFLHQKSWFSICCSYTNLVVSRVSKLVKRPGKEYTFLVFLQMLTLRSYVDFFFEKMEKLFFPYFMLIFKKSRSRDHYLEKNFFVKKWLDLSVKKCKKTRNSWSFTYTCIHISHKKDRELLVFICV